MMSPFDGSPFIDAIQRVVDQIDDAKDFFGEFPDAVKAWENLSKLPQSIRTKALNLKRHQN